MGFMTALSNGWQLTKNSFKVLKENKELIIFPILSGISIVLLTGSFVVAFLASYGWDFEAIDAQDDNAQVIYIVSTFLFYLINYFVVIFFNIALIHCTRMYFRGEKVSIQKGLQFSVSRIGAIFTWSLFAATVGTILKAIQENVGILGKIITGVIGIIWSIATFFVMPIIAYENVGPIEAFKRSANLMKKQWGESLVANFSFALVQMIAMLLICVPLLFLGVMIHPFVGVVFALLGAFVIMAVTSATQTIFISAVYHNVNGDPIKHFNDGFANNLFNEKN